MPRKEMGIEKEGVPEEENGMKLKVNDSSVDYKGRAPDRASTGSWRASFFIIGIFMMTLLPSIQKARTDVVEFSERMSFFGISANLITYMTKVMHQDLATAANSVNIWAGVTTITPLLGGILADAYTGRFVMVLYSAVVYVLGLCLFTMTQYIPSLKPCGATLTSCVRATKVHKQVFYFAAYLVALATGGYRPCLECFGADQFDDNDSIERKQKMSFFNWWVVSLCCGLFLGVTVMVYLEDNLGWGVAFITFTVVMVVTVFVFVAGRRLYRYQKPLGSSFVSMVQVMVAAFAKRKLSLPSDSTVLHEVSKLEGNVRGRLLCHTNRLRFLDKAAIIEFDNGSITIEKKQSPWKLVTVTQVEELKLILSMVPLWFTFFIFGVGISQTNTFFIKQASTMDRKVFNGRFEIPPASVSFLVAISNIVTVALYDRLLVPYLRRATGNERGMNILKRIGIGMVFLTIALGLSAIVEKKRLRALERRAIINVFWLAPQFLFIGVADGFSLVGMQEYFYDQAPDSLRSLGMGFFLSVIGVGSFISTFLTIVVNYITGKTSAKKWIGKDVNHSRLDYFYWVLTGISVLNTFVFVLLTRNYRYKNVERNVDDDESHGEDPGQSLYLLKGLSEKADVAACGISI